MTGDAALVRVWDLPKRLFHAALDASAALRGGALCPIGMAPAANP